MNTLVLSTEQVSCEMLAMTVIWFNSCNYSGDSGFPCVSDGKDSACKARNLSSIPGLGRSPGEGKGYPFQYSSLENSMDCIVHGVAKRQTWLSDFHFHFTEVYFVTLYIVHFYTCSVHFSSVQSLSRVQLSATPYTIQSMEFSRLEYWSG